MWVRKHFQKLPTHYNTPSEKKRQEEMKKKQKEAVKKGKNSIQVSNSRD